MPHEHETVRRGDDVQTDAQSLETFPSISITTQFQTFFCLLFSLMWS